MNLRKTLVVPPRAPAVCWAWVAQLGMESHRAERPGPGRAGGAALPAESGAAWDLLSSGVALHPGGPRSRRALRAGLAGASRGRGMTVCSPAGPQPLRQLRAVLSRREQICHGQRRWPGEGWTGLGWGGGPVPREGAHPAVPCHSAHGPAELVSVRHSGVTSSSPRNEARSPGFAKAQGTQLCLPVFKRNSKLSLGAPFPD